MKVINPATEEVIAELAEDAASAVELIVQKLRKGQRIWAQVNLAERISIIEKFGQLILDHKDDLAETLTSETGKPLQQSLNEIIAAQNRIAHIKTYAAKWLADEELVMEGETLEYIKYEPLGVIANISAWNFPYNVGFNVFLYALIGGNSVLYKPSEYASLTGLAFQKYLHEAGVPENVFQAAIGGGQTGQAILKAKIDAYFFTGSFATGQHIAEVVAPKLVPVQLELGGKDPLYVADDVADVKQTAINVAEGAFYNNGQSCCAVERVYVHEAIYEEFVQFFKEEVESYKIGDPRSLDTFLGPLTRKPQINILSHQIEDAIAKGAEVITGGRSIEGKGYFFEPTVVVGVNHDMFLMQEESFGPVIGIQKVSSDQEAIDLMLDTQYGLTSAVFTSNEERAKTIMGQMDSGTVYWNCCDRVSPNVPWTGRKNSGMGSTLSSQGIRAFVQPKAYHMRKGG